MTDVKGKTTLVTIQLPVEETMVLPPGNYWVMPLIKGIPSDEGYSDGSAGGYDIELGEWEDTSFEGMLIVWAVETELYAHYVADVVHAWLNQCKEDAELYTDLSEHTPTPLIVEEITEIKPHTRLYAVEPETNTEGYHAVLLDEPPTDSGIFPIEDIVL